MPSTATLLLFLILVTTRSTATSAPIPGLDTFLSHHAHLDPLSLNDSFPSLPSSLKKSLSHSSPLPHPYIPSRISSLLSLSLSLSLHIRLVGPSFPSDSYYLLSSFLSSTHSSDHFHVIAPDPFPYHDSHRLAIKHSPHFEISHASSSLSSRLSDALNYAISSTPSSFRSPLISVPYDTVDHIIKQDFDK